MEPTSNVVPPVQPAPLAPNPVISPMPPQMPPVQAAPQMVPPLPKKHHLIALTILVILLVIIGGGATFAAKLGFFESPQTAVKNAFLGLAKNTTTFHGEVTIPVMYTLPSGTQTATVTVSEDADKADINNPSIQGHVTFTGLGLIVDADFIVVSKTFYFKINQLPLAALANSPIIGNWISLSHDDLVTLAQKYSSASTTVSTSADLTPADFDAMYAIIEKDNVFSSINSLGISNKNGTYVKTYQINVDKDAAFNALIDIANQFQTKNNLPAQVLTDDQKAAITKELENITIDPMMLDIEVANGEVAGLSTGVGLTEPTSSSTPPIQAHVGITTLYSNYGETLNITAPAGSKSLLTLLASSTAVAQQKGTDAAIQEEISSFRANAEIYSSNNNMSYAGVCKDNDPSVKLIMSTLVKDSGSAPTCIDSTTKYAIAAKLTAGGYFCADSTGVAETILGKPLVASCQ